MMELHADLIGLAVLAVVLVAMRGILSDLWNLIFVAQLPTRRRIVLASFAFTYLAIVFVALHVVGFGKLRAVAFLVIAIAPTVSWQVASWWAWVRDDATTRRMARAIAIRRLSQAGEALPKADAWVPWKDYMFDVEVARRQAAYEPPPI